MENARNDYALTSSGNCLTWACSRRGAGGPTPFKGAAGGRRAGGLIAALREALGPAGTLVMPGMTEDDDHL